MGGTDILAAVADQFSPFVRALVAIILAVVGLGGGIVLGFWGIPKVWRALNTGAPQAGGGGGTGLSHADGGDRSADIDEWFRQKYGRDVKDYF